MAGEEKEPLVGPSDLFFSSVAVEEEEKPSVALFSDAPIILPTEFPEDKYADKALANVITNTKPADIIVLDNEYLERLPKGKDIAIAPAGSTVEDVEKQMAALQSYFPPEHKLEVIKVRDAANGKEWFAIAGLTGTEANGIMEHHEKTQNKGKEKTTEKAQEASIPDDMSPEDKLAMLQAKLKAAQREEMLGNAVDRFKYKADDLYHRIIQTLEDKFTSLVATLQYGRASSLENRFQEDKALAGELLAQNAQAAADKQNITDRIKTAETNRDLAKAGIGKTASIAQEIATLQRSEATKAEANFKTVSTDANTKIAALYALKTKDVDGNDVPLFKDDGTSMGEKLANLQSTKHMLEGMAKVGGGVPPESLAAIEANIAKVQEVVDAQNKTEQARIEMMQKADKANKAEQDLASINAKTEKKQEKVAKEYDKEINHLKKDEKEIDKLVNKNNRKLDYLQGDIELALKGLQKHGKDTITGGQSISDVAKQITTAVPKGPNQNQVG